MNRLHVVNGHGFRPSPHIEPGSEYADLDARIRANFERRMQQHRRLELWIWLILGAAVAAPIIAALAIYVTLRA